MTSFIENNLTLIFFIVLGVCVVVTVVVALLYLRLRKLEVATEFLSRGMKGRSFAEIVVENINETERLLEAVKALSRKYDLVLNRLAGTLQHVGVVRYDAFRELGGRLSFSVAMLDDRGNGIIVSSIYGRSESRTYAKPVVEGSSSYNLSPEETAAIRRAMQSRDRGAFPMEEEDREHEERIAKLKLFHEKELEWQVAGTGEAPLETKEPRVTTGGEVETGAAKRGSERRLVGGSAGARGAGTEGRRARSREVEAGEKTGKVSLREYVEGMAQKQPGKDYDRLRSGMGRGKKLVSDEGEVKKVRNIRPGGEPEEKKDEKGRRSSPAERAEAEPGTSEAPRRRGSPPRETPRGE